MLLAHFLFVFLLIVVASFEATDAPAAARLPSQGVGQRASAMQEFARVLASVSQYTATVTLFERKGVRTQRAVYDYTFRRPAAVTLHAVSGARAGYTLVWDGGDTVVAHRGSGLLSMVKKTLSLHDPITTTIRGSSIDELSFNAILAHARGTSGRLMSRPGGAVRGEATEAVTLVPKHATTDGGFTREILQISTTSHLPMRVLGYEGSTLVRQIDFSHITLGSSASTACRVCSPAAASCRSSRVGSKTAR